MTELTQIALSLGISTSLLIALILIGIWDGIWKLIAMWKAARKNEIAWFIFLAVLNTAGILPILYIYLFSKLPAQHAKKSKKRR